MNLSRTPLLFALVVFSAAKAQVAHVYQEKGLQSVAQYATVFRDSTHQFTIDEVSAPEMQRLFRPTQGEQSNYNISTDVFWVHIRLAAHGDGPWDMHADPPLLSDMRIYQRTAGGWDTAYVGYKYPLHERELDFNTNVFPLRLADGDTVDCYIRVESAFPVFIRLKTGTTVDFWEMQFADSIFTGIFFGIMLLMVFYNLFLYLTNRDRVYIYYVLYVISCVIFISFTNGYVNIFPDIFRRIFMFNPMIFPSLFGYFGLFFTIRFLNTKKYAPKLHKLIYALMILVLGATFVGFASPHLGTMIIQLLGVILSILCVVTGFRVHRQGYKPARYYLFGFGIYMLGLTTYIVLAVANVNTGNLTPPYILMASSAIEAIILSFAIGDKLNIAIRDKQAAQEEKMEAVKENERIVREQNVELEKKVERRTHEIQLQKAIIEEKNKDILDSIHYAKRIQGALLASENLLKKNLPEYFVFYRPKDIVSGDFYWGGELPGDKFLLLTGDCTGHGVPGAFMSLLNISILHELTTGLQLSRPNEILNRQRDAIIMALNPEGAEEVSKDGMDCVLCSFDFANKKLDFACANNPVWLLRDGAITDFRPDKFPVGIHEGEKTPFTLQTSDLRSGDIVYTFTDGFADQFGGPKGKKFKYSRLKEQLTELKELPMAAQKATLEKVFDAWKGGIEQLDDVLVIGVKIR